MRRAFGLATGMDAKTEIAAGFAHSNHSSSHRFGSFPTVLLTEEDDELLARASLRERLCDALRSTSRRAVRVSVRRAARIAFVGFTTATGDVGTGATTFEVGALKRSVLCRVVNISKSIVMCLRVVV